MTRYYCHECAHEGSDFATSQDGFTCPRCGGAFVEEIPDNDGMADDPREFDPADEEEEDHVPLGFFRSGGGGAANNPAQNNTGNRAGGNYFHYESPGGGFVFTGGFGGVGGAAAAGANPQPHPGAANPLAYSLMQAFGLAPPAQGPHAAAAAGTAATSGQGRPHARRWQSAGANDPANRPQGHEQVPIQNLATFLNDAFGGEPHPADDPGNNPFAEGGHETGPEPEREPGRAENERAAQHPLGALFSLFGHVLGGQGGGVFGLPTHANAGDYVWGSEANFQQLLNDLMEQAAVRAGPQPAPDEMIEKLPRLKISQDVLDMDSITTCGVCLDAFQLDDSAVALPCKHLYHEDCLVPWLKTSGTCPICRYALVPQPGQPGYGEEGREAQSTSGTASSSAGPSATGASSAAAAAAGAEGSRVGLNAPDAQPPRPPLSSRPSTAQIPDVEGGSTLPGSWIWPAREESDRRSPTEQNALATNEGSGDHAEAAAADCSGPEHDSRDPDEVPLLADRERDPDGVEAGSARGEESARSAARAAAEAAERRRAAEAAERDRQQPTPRESDRDRDSAAHSTSDDGQAGPESGKDEGGMPIIEDVD
ncbi:hypothetical protein JCM3774_004701 [Rhodotorula dairenensis]